MEIIEKNKILATLNDLKPELIHQYGVSKIGIFGSVARDENQPDSDLDIVVHMKPDILKRIKLKNDLENRFDLDIDLIRYWYGMNPYLKARIDREAIYV